MARAAPSCPRAQAKNVANTNVLWWGGRLLALWEGGRPHLLDSLSLATSRESDLAGLLKKGDTFSAHPRFDRARNRLVNFAYMPNPVSGQTQLTFFEFGPDFRPIDKEKPRLTVSIPGFCLVHDFALTANYYVVVQAPTSFSANPLDILLGKKSLGEGRAARGAAKPCWRMRATPAFPQRANRLPPHAPSSRCRAGESISFDGTKQTLLWLIPRNGGKPVSIPVRTHFSFHHANAYEDEEGRVILDSASAPTLELGSASAQGGQAPPIWETVDFAQLPCSTLWRYTLDPKSASGSCKELFRRHVDFPSVHPRCSARAHRYIYAVTGGSSGSVASPFRGVAKIDTSDAAQHAVWLPPSPSQFVGEPVFTPRAGASAESAEDDGYLLVPVIDGERGQKGSVFVLNADNIAAGPIATIELDTFLPHGLHGTFVPELAPTSDEIAKATTLMKLYARKSQEWNVVDGSFSGMGFKSLFQKGVDGR